MSRTVISGLRTGPQVFLISLGAVLVGYMLYADLTGGGLTETVFYRLLGNWIYPVIYGSLAIGMMRALLMLRRRDDYLAVENGHIAMGRKKIPLGEIHSISLGRTSLVEEMVFHRQNGTDLVIKTYMLSRPAADVLSDLKKHVLNANGPTSRS